MKLLMLLLRSAPLFSLLLTFGLYKPLTEAVFKPQKPALSFKSFPTDGFGLVFTNTVQEFLFFLPVHPEISSLAVSSLIGLEDEKPWGLRAVLQTIWGLAWFPRSALGLEQVIIQSMFSQKCIIKPLASMIHFLCVDRSVCRSGTAQVCPKA